MSDRLLLMLAAVGNDHVDGTHTDMKSWCQTPPEVALAQLQALVACPHARVKGGPEDGKVLMDTASAYQVRCNYRGLILLLCHAISLHGSFFARSFSFYFFFFPTQCRFIGPSLQNSLVLLLFLCRTGARNRPSAPS